MIFRTFYAFLLRDFRQTVSYKFAFLLDIGSIFFNAATFYFVAKLFEGAASPALKSYNGDYFPFVLIGIAFSTYQSIGLNSFSQSLRQEQYLGTLESLLVTPLRVPTLLAGSALWDFIYASVEVLIYFVIAVAAFGFRLGNVNVLSALFACLLTLTTFMGLGVLAAAFILRFKKGNPVTWLIASASELFGGVYFPTTVLPDWMKQISEWIPMTHALNALRMSLLQNATFKEIAPDLGYLTAFTVLIWPIGVIGFNWALDRSQADGTLGHY